MGARRLPAVRAAVEIMKDEGVDTVFGCPGSALLPLYAAMERTGGIAHLSAGHAEGATHMADGWARTTGKVGVAAVAAGPGRSGCSAACTRHSRTPSRWCASPVGRRPRRRPRRTVAARGYRPPDLVRLAGAVTKRAERIEDPARIPGASVRRSASRGRAGPGPY
ncbi:thiamine pyrophosphate-binding protein [Streptomyces albulus]|nr:thiamine pyrophosphate-binding protein [Streptomyces noursei]